MGLALRLGRAWVPGPIGLRIGSARTFVTLAAGCRASITINLYALRRGVCMAADSASRSGGTCRRTGIRSRPLATATVCALAVCCLRFCATPFAAMGGITFLPEVTPHVLALYASVALALSVVPFAAPIGAYLRR